MNYTRLFSVLAFGLITLTTVSAQTPTDAPAQSYHRNPNSYGQPPYGRPDYRDRDWDRDRDYGYDRGYYGDDWRRRNWDGYGPDAFQFDHEFWRGRWRDELDLNRAQRREMERIDAYYDRFRVSPRDPRFRQMQRQKFGDMLSVMTPRQRAIVLNRVQPYRDQYGNRGNGPYRRPGYPGY